jgi:hypothetical protein
MAVLTVYRSDCSLVRPSGRYSIDWEEFSWEPRPREDRTVPGRWRHWRSAPQAIAIGTRLGTQGLSAESVHWLAVRGEKGFSLMGGDSDMAKKRAADGPGLFGSDEPAGAPESTAYPKPGLVVMRLNGHAEPRVDPGNLLRPVVAELAREVIDPVVARVNRLEASIREALRWLDDEQGIPQPLTAFNILTQAMEVPCPEQTPS